MTLRSLAATLSLALSLVAGCTPPAATTRDAVTAVDAAADAATTARPAPAASEYLVWTRGPDGAVATHWVREAGRGVEVVARRDGVVVAGATDLWAYATRAARVPMYECGSLADDQDVEPRRAGFASSVRATLSSLTRDDEEAVVAQPGTAEDDTEAMLREHDLRATVVASAGPYLFVRVDEYEMGCGAAHGSSGSAVEAWDVSGAFPVALGSTALDAAGRAAVTRELLPAAVDSLRRVLADDGGEVAPADVELAALLPRYDGAALRASYVFTTFACYACGDHAWSSYTAAATLEARALPSLLAPYASAPAAVAHFAGARRDAALGGWSEVPRRGDRAALLRAFDTARR